MFNKLWETRNPTLLKVFFGLILIIAILFVSSGLFAGFSFAASHNKIIGSNSTIVIPSTTSSTWTSQSVQTAFDLPGILQPSYSVAVDCVVSSNSFVQNNPSTINVSLSFPVNYWTTINIVSIEVQPVDAVELINLNKPYESTGFSDFYLYPVATIGANQDWNGSDYVWVLFEDSGLIQLKLTIFALPQQSDLVTNSNFNDNFNTTIPIPIYIESSQDAQLQQTQQTWQNAMLNETSQNLVLQQQLKNQQESSGDMNFSLTFLIIAIMILDIAMLVFDHSVDEDRKQKYEKEQSKQNPEKPESHNDFSI